MRYVNEQDAIKKFINYIDKCDTLTKDKAIEILSKALADAEYKDIEVRKDEIE